MTVMEAILARKSIRDYQDRPVSQEALESVLEAGRLAPSARNAQAWKFTVVRDPQLLAQMGGACCNQSFVSRAPVILVVCANAPAQMSCRQSARTVDCSIALSFMMLEAAQQGLGTCWLGAFSQDDVRRVLNIPEEYDIVAVSPLGYPAKEGAPRKRKDLKELVVWDRWDGQTN